MGGVKRSLYVVSPIRICDSEPKQWKQGDPIINHSQ